MPKPAAARTRSFATALRQFLPAYVLFALAALTTHPLSLIALLGADALAMTAICHALGFDMEVTFARSVLRRGLTYFVLLTGYTALVAAVLAGPVWWLSHAGSLPAALSLSGALVLALLVLWRLWPAFALPFIWDDAFPHAEQRSWLWAALSRSLAFARHLTGEHELFFSHGLPAAFCLLLLTTGALSLAGLGFLPSEFRIVALAFYGIVIMPFAQLALANRSLRALLTEARRSRRPSPALVDDDAAPPASKPAALPAGIGAAELNATLLNAARSGQVELALAALERGGDPNAAPAPHERDQRNVLILAVTLPDLRLLRALIAKGVDINRAQAGLTALIAATRDSYQGRPDAVMTLLANGADPRIADGEGNTALHCAARCAEPIVAALLLDAAAEIDAVNREGATPLGIACANANWPVATFFLDCRAKAEIDHSQPALLLAASIADDDPAGIKLLLKHKAKVDARGSLDRTPLIAAALAGHARIAEALLAAGAEPNLADRHGTTALMEAARSGAVAVVNALGKRKVKPDAIDASGRSALIIACQSRQASEEAVRALLALGAERELKGGDGKRALDHAAAAGRWHIVALLDPAYPVPSTLAAGAPAAETANAAHLLDALRFGHWNVADGFAAAAREWPQSELAALFLALVEPGQQSGRTWLLNAGLAIDATTDDGRSLFDAVLAELPESYEALGDLVARGAPIGGAALVARLLAAAPRDERGPHLRALARELFERGADVCGRLAGEVGALHLATGLGEVALASDLLARGADPNARDAHGRTPLHYALRSPPETATALLRVLILHGANPETAAANGETALGLALARPEREAGYWLNWARWRLPGRRLLASDLPAAAAAGDIEAVERLLALGFPLDATDAAGATALIRAAGSGYAALVVRLLEAGADSAHAALSGATCLSAAVSARREAVVHTLLEHGVRPDQRLPGGGTPLMIAAALGLPRLAEPLLAKGADVDSADDRGTTALHAAAQFAFDGRDTAAAADLIDLLLRKGAALDARNAAGQTALLLLLGARAEPGSACDPEHLAKLATMLVDRGAALSVQDQRGVSVLHACAMHGLLGPARLLKGRGADLELRDTLGRTAGDIATLLGFRDVAAELGGARNPVPTARQTLRKPARAPD